MTDAIELKPRLSNFDAAMLSSFSGLKSIDDEIERLEAMRLRQREHLRLALIDSSESRSHTIAGYGTATVLDGKVLVEVVDEALVPVAFRKVSIDTAKAGKVLKNDGAVPGLKLGEPGEPTLRIVWEKAVAS